MFKVPKDFRERSINTQIQLLILQLIKLYGSVLITLGGIAFISNNFGTYFSLGDILIYSGISLVLIISVSTVYLKYLKTKLGKNLEEIQYQKDDLIQKFEKESKKEYISGKSEFLKTIVKLEYLGKETFVGIEYKPRQGMEKEEIARIALDDMFKDMIIQVELKAPPEKAQE
jgi:hypothetical protein